ncbi:helix-turn-helix transcriptional regulator [Mesorhizobium sp. LjNodule214]|uniref:helix-turn-helix transcriptional regulator n=1 Tax=Mesorhizobium sp. LjNodule214 TaxID=3342252 RepID=UPI003ECF08D3
MERTDTANVFNARLSFWTAAGFSGAALYEALATDDTLPAFFDPEDLASIQGVKPSAVKKHRHRGTGPAFLKLSSKIVKYPRGDFCRHLASRFVKRAA